MIPTVADNLKNYLKYKQLEIKQTQKKKDYICYQGHEYLAHTSAPPPFSSVGQAITHQAQVSIAPQTTSGFARAYQTFISNLGNSGTYQNSNVGIESNTDLPLEVAHVLMDLHQNINDPHLWTRYQNPLNLPINLYIEFNLTKSQN
ncbi:unnamed protein product [Gordionus sp. m RMFG-2023]